MPAIAPHDTPVVDRPWDGPAAVAAAPNDREVLRYMHAWVDPEGDPDAKSSYKLPHHGPRVGAPANLAACRAGLAVLGGARGGVAIPAADRDEVSRHLRAHLGDAGA